MKAFPETQTRRTEMMRIINSYNINYLNRQGLHCTLDQIGTALAIGPVQFITEVDQEMINNYRSFSSGQNSSPQKVEP